MNEAVFSPWNGQSPLYVVPAFFSWTVSPTMSTMFSLLLISACTVPAVSLASDPGHPTSWSRT